MCADVECVSVCVWRYRVCVGICTDVECVGVCAVLCGVCVGVNVCIYVLCGDCTLCLLQEEGEGGRREGGG